MSMRLAVAVSGRGSNLQALLTALRGSTEAEVVLVLSNRADAPALDFARRSGVAAETLTDWRSGSEWLEKLERERVALVVLAGYLKKVPPEVVTAFQGRMINIHPALLPDFGGPGMYGHRVHEAVLQSGARESGATVHLVTNEFDRGPILAQARVPVRSNDTPDALAARVLEAEHRLLPAVVLAAARAGKPVPLARPLTAMEP